MYLQKNYKKCKETVPYQLTEDRDEQKDATYQWTAEKDKSAAGIV